MNDYYTILAGVIFIINLAGFLLSAIDKRRAKKKMWRVPEKYFFILSIFGGCPGVYTGFITFRHKTRHKKFMIGIPIIFVIQIGLIIYILS